MNNYCCGSGRTSPRRKPASSGCCCGPSSGETQQQEWDYPEEGPQNSVRRQYQCYKGNPSPPPDDDLYQQFDYQQGYRTEYEEDFAEPYCADYVDGEDYQEEAPKPVVTKTRRVRRRTSTSMEPGDVQMPVCNEEPQVQEECFVEDIPTECGTMRKITNRRTTRSTKTYRANEDVQPEYYDQAEAYYPEPAGYEYDYDQEDGGYKGCCSSKNNA